MNKYSAILKGFGMLFTNSNEFMRSIFRVIKDLWSKGEVKKKYNLPNGLPALDLLDLFPEFNETITHYSYLDSTSKAIDIAFIKQIIKSKKDVNYIEFGSWRGESLINIYKDTNECYSLTLSKQQMREFGFAEVSINASDFFTDKIAGIKHIQHNSQTYNFNELKGKFDVIFVDADHEYPGVKIDTANAFSLLRDDKSVIIWHDYGKSYETINWPVLHGILDGMPAQTHKNIYKVQNTLCAMYTKQNVNAKYFTPYLPDKVFTITIKGEKINT